MSRSKYALLFIGIGGFIFLALCGLAAFMIFSTLETETIAGPTKFQAGERIQVGDYDIIVHQITQEYVLNRDDEQERIVYANVEYHNNTQDKALSYRLNQWSLFDVEGYAYEYEISSYLYQERDKQRLRESLLNPQTHVRGWVAFKVPQGVVLERLQFLTGFLAGQAADIMVGELGE